MAATLGREVLRSALGAATPTVILHGLLGASRNWRSIGKSLVRPGGVAGDVHLLDLRNHGDAQHMPSMTYEEMSLDVKHYLEENNIKKANIIGHSMGGMTSMVLALRHPEVIKSLTVVDIAPVARTKPRQGEIWDIIEGVTSADVGSVSKRSAVADMLRGKIPNDVIRGFIMGTNLYKTDEGRFAWKSNIDVIRESYPELMQWPEKQLEGMQNQAPVLVVRGSRSDYINETAHPEVFRRYFPDSKIISLEAGHWVHSEMPLEFVEAVEEHIK